MISNLQLTVAQCAQNAKKIQKIHYIIKQYPMITNEGSIESKLCSTSFEIGHNGDFSILKTLGGHFNNMSIMAQKPSVGIPLLKLIFRNISLVIFDVLLQ